MQYTVISLSEVVCEKQLRENYGGGNTQCQINNEVFEKKQLMI